MTSYKIILIFSIITSCDARPLIDPRQYSENRKGDVIYCFVWGFIAAENSREPSWVHGTYPEFHSIVGGSIECCSIEPPTIEYCSIECKSMEHHSIEQGSIEYSSIEH